MSKTILVIDDEPDFVAVLKSRLEAHNFDVQTAFDGYEGLQRIEKQKPNLIILDIEMPEMDGYTFVLEFKKKYTMKDIPIIVLTAKDELQDIFELEGIHSYLTKPFEHEDLLKRIKDYLS